jgi:hypothetical protein
MNENDAGKTPARRSRKPSAKSTERIAAPAHRASGGPLSVPIVGIGTSVSDTPFWPIPQLHEKPGPGTRTTPIVTAGCCIVETAAKPKRPAQYCLDLLADDAGVQLIVAAR